MESYWEDQPPVKIWEYPPNQSSMVAIEQFNLKKTLEIYIPLKIGPKKIHGAIGLSGDRQRLIPIPMIYPVTGRQKPCPKPILTT